MVVTWQSHDIHMMWMCFTCLAQQSVKKGCSYLQVGGACSSNHKFFLHVSVLLLAAHTVFVGGIGDSTEDDLYEFFSSNDAEPSDVRVIGSKGLVECLQCTPLLADPAAVQWHY